MFWYDNAIIYHIYPLGFCGAPTFNDDGPIEYRLDKIYEWIDHFKKLNITAVYFGPVFESVQHGYDTTDYTKIDRRLGDNESFKKICRTLHDNGIKIILDGVFNHVGRKFPKFVDIQQNGRISAYCGWFQNLNFDGNSPCGDNFWYEGWNGHYNLVKLNLRNPEVSDYIINCVNFWIDEFDIDGIRFDAADCIDFDFFKRIRQFCKNKKHDFWLMGEIIHGDYKRWANNDMLDSVTNYECYKGLYSSHNDKNYFEIDYSINRQSGNYGIYKDVNLYTFVDNHDVNRLASTLNNPEHLKNVYTMLYTIPGIPSIYYGSEFGIHGRKENNSDDNLRPSLDINNIPDKNNSLLEHIIKLGRIYMAYPALRTGTYSTIIIRNQQILFKKQLGEQIIYIALNLEDKDFDFNFHSDVPNLVDVISGDKIYVDNYNASFKAKPFSSFIMVTDDIVNNIPDVQDNKIELEENKETEIIIGAKYRHFKGNMYEVIALAKHSETLEELVVYKALYGDGQVWVRPKSLFTNMAGNDRRFTLCNE